MSEKENPTKVILSNRSDSVSAIGSVAILPGSQMAQSLADTAGFTEMNQPTFTPEKGNAMEQELHIPAAQYQNLQALVGELLLTNQRLRLELSRLEGSASFNASAIHLQRHPSH